MARPMKVPEVKEIKTVAIKNEMFINKTSFKMVLCYF